MSSSLASRIRRSTAFRLTALYTLLYTGSSLLLFVLAYVLLAGLVRSQDQKLIMEKLHEYSYLERTKGLAALADFIRRDSEEYEYADYFVRLIDPAGTEALTVTPPGWTLPAKSPPFAAWEDGVWRQWGAGEAGERLYETTARRQPSGAVIVVGADVRQREALLADFQQIFLFITGSVVLVGVGVGALLANRSLAPVRDLIAAVNATSEGAMTARVPTRGTGDELDELAVLFNSMLERIAHLIQGMRDALDNVAHDLRTPLTRAKAVIETALSSDLSRQGLREALMDLAEENERIRATLTTLMDISEAETGAMRLDLTPTDVAGLIEESVEIYEYLALERGIILISDAPPGLTALADAGRVRQVLANLLDNALKYSRPGGTVHVTGRSGEGRVQVVVADEGEGIPEEDLPRIFERLYRGDKSRSHRGLGLGLSLVQAVLKAHGGDITASSRVGRGSRFEFSLPAA